MSSTDGKIEPGKDRGAILELLYQVIQERKDCPAEKSYTASLFRKGLDTILKKTGEEAFELAIAGKGGKREEIVYEAGDLLYHLLVLLAYYDIEPEEIYHELRRRFGISGIVEKESRGS
ncbi:MAG TPA: phosphoribosyl-ATP diphosphatase [Synergistaceae bacterium]|nr:phosphoribosyl-ATP diphosphatase [Synergistaceae bacterium]